MKTKKCSVHGRNIRKGSPYVGLKNPTSGGLDLVCVKCYEKKGGNVASLKRVPGEVATSTPSPPTPLKATSNVATTKTGLKHFKKGSPEAKAFMASLRAKRMKKLQEQKNPTSESPIAQDTPVSSEIRPVLDISEALETPEITEVADFTQEESAPMMVDVPMVNPSSPPSEENPKMEEVAIVNPTIQKVAIVNPSRKKSPSPRRIIGQIDKRLREAQEKLRTLRNPIALKKMRNPLSSSQVEQMQRVYGSRSQESRVDTETGLPMRNPRMRRINRNPWFTGRRRSDRVEEAFWSRRKPTEQSHGHRYSYVTGPKKSRRDAENWARFVDPHIGLADKNPLIFCEVCGEESGGAGSSMFGLVHKYGPRGHPFTAQSWTEENPTRLRRIPTPRIFRCEDCGGRGAWKRADKGSPTLCENCWLKFEFNQPRANPSDTQCDCGDSAEFDKMTGHWYCNGCGSLISECACKQPLRLRGARPIAKRIRRNPEPCCAQNASGQSGHSWYCAETESRRLMKKRE